MELAKIELKLNQPIYVGFAIMDFRKTLIYDLHYNYIKRKHPDSMLLFIKTDSLTYQIQTDSLYKDFYINNHLFNFSGYEEDSPFYNEENKREISKMRNHLNKKFIEKFVGSKMYSSKTKKEEMKKSKGVKKHVVKKDTRHQDYVDCLFEERKIMHTMHSIQSFKHQLYTIKQNKVSLILYNDE